jgi:hypothetical protein
LAPSAKVIVEKPDTDTYCPASGKKLKMKELIPVSTKYLLLTIIISDQGLFSE